MVLKIYMLQLNVLSGPWKKIYAPVPIYAYIPNYKDFYVELSLAKDEFI